MPLADLEKLEFLFRSTRRAEVAIRRVSTGLQRAASTWLVLETILFTLVPLTLLNFAFRAFALIDGLCSGVAALIVPASAHLNAAVTDA